MTIRPVECFFCEEQMYYHGNKQWVPEVQISVESKTPFFYDDFHAHLTCWKKFKEEHGKEKIS